MYRNKEGIITLSPEQEKYRLEHPNAPFDDTGPYDTLKEEKAEIEKDLDDHCDSM